MEGTMLWLELLGESEIVKPDLLAPLHAEAEELLKITITAIKATRKRN